MRKIEFIVVHCTAGSQRNTAMEVVNYHIRPISAGGLGWRTPGYHYIVEASGKIVQCVDHEKVANGVRGHNQNSVHVAYVGGVDTSKRGMPAIDNRTPQQRKALVQLLKRLHSIYPGAEILGHRDFKGTAKMCPSFDAKTEYKDI